METKTNVLLLIVILVILLVSVITLKIRGDKKREKMAIASSDREISINNDKNETFGETIKSRGKKSFLEATPSFVLAILTWFITLVFLFAGIDIIEGIFRIRENSPEGNSIELVFMILGNFIIAGGCFYICRQNHKSFFYVPLLCNLTMIISAIVEPSFWKGFLWIISCSGWVLSIITSLIGARIGKRKAIIKNL